MWAGAKEAAAGGDSGKGEMIMHRIEARVIDEREAKEDVDARVCTIGLIAVVGYAMLCGLLLLNTTGG